MRIRRRRDEDEPVVLPSLDRLSGLIERVVELVDAVGDAKQAPAPQPVVEAPQEPPSDVEPEPAPPAGWVAFVHSAHGYRLVEETGAVPSPGDAIELEGTPHRVVKVGPSPLPGDPRRCVYAVGEERQEAGRTSDA